MRQQKWNREKIVADIKAWVDSGRKVSRIMTENRPLFRAGVNHFGTWRAAVNAAGYDLRSCRKWSAERVVKEIMAWSEDPFATTLIQYDPQLAQAAKKYFGSVEEALELLDIEVKGRHWTRKKVIDTIQLRYVRGEPVRLIGLGDIRLYYVAKRKFGTWKNALEAAGLSNRYSERENLRSWGPKQVILAIRQWNDQHGNLKKVYQQDPGFYSVAKKHFGSWTKAVEAAGFSVSRRSAKRTWSREMIISDLRRLHAECRSVSSTIFVKLDAPLVSAAQRYFGSWRAALDAAGLPSSSQPSVDQRSAG